MPFLAFAIAILRNGIFGACSQCYSIQVKKTCKVFGKSLYSLSFLYFQISILVCSKFRSRLQEANLERATAKQKLEESSTERRMLEEQNTKKDKKINELSARLKQSDENARKQVDQVILTGDDGTEF